MSRKASPAPHFLSRNEHHARDRTALRDWIRLLSNDREPKLIVRAGTSPETCYIIARNRKANQTFADAMGGHPGRIRTLADLPFLLRRSEVRESWRQFIEDLWNKIGTEKKTFQIADPPDPHRPAEHLRHVRHFDATNEVLPGKERYTIVKFLESTDIHELAFRHRAFLNAYGPIRGLEFVQSFIDLRHAFALVFMDIDYFGDFNKEAGQDAGDAVLRAWIDFLNRELRESDIFYSRGGDEFVAVLSLSSAPSEGDTVKVMVNVMRKLVDKFYQQGVDIGGKIAHVAISFGVVIVDDFSSPVSAEERVNQASLRMSENKRMKRFRSEGIRQAKQALQDEIEGKRERPERLEHHREGAAKLGWPPGR